ncbi:UNVERIFIED_CONTAM: hypothetical protein NCL1_13326 [Trichonephila clavipes]
MLTQLKLFVTNISYIIFLLLLAAQKAKANAAENSTPKVNNINKVEHEYDVTPEAISPGDVIDDIENMLANLSDQLDAMLDEEVQK